MRRKRTDLLPIVVGETYTHKSSGQLRKVIANDGADITYEALDYGRCFVSCKPGEQRVVAIKYFRESLLIPETIETKTETLDAQAPEETAP